MFFVASEENIILRSKGFKTVRKAAKWARTYTDQEVRILDSEKGMDYTEIPEEELLSRAELVKRMKTAQAVSIKEREERTRAQVKAAQETRNQQRALIDAGFIPVEVLRNWITSMSTNGRDYGGSTMEVTFAMPSNHDDFEVLQRAFGMIRKGRF